MYDVRSTTYDVSKTVKLLNAVTSYIKHRTSYIDRTPYIVSIRIPLIVFHYLSTLAAPLQTTPKKLYCQ